VIDIVEKNFKMVGLNIRQFDDSNKLVYSGSIHVGVEEHETFNDLLKRMIEASEIDPGVKKDVKEYLMNPSGDRGVMFYIINGMGERVALNLKERVADISRRYGTNQINMDIGRIVGRSL